MLFQIILSSILENYGGPIYIKQELTLLCFNLWITERETFRPYNKNDTGIKDLPYPPPNPRKGTQF